MAAPVSLPASTVSSSACVILSVFVLLAVLAGVKWCVTVVVICVSLVTGAIEHLHELTGLLCASLGKCEFRAFAH